MSEFNKFIKKFFIHPEKETEQTQITQARGINSQLEVNLAAIKSLFAQSADLIIREAKKDEHRFAVLSMENMVDKDEINKQLIEKIISCDTLPDDPSQCFEYIELSVSTAPDQRRAQSFDDAVDCLMSGMAVFILDGTPEVLVLSVQNFPARSVNEPKNEIMERASHEGFVEVLKDNIAMIRRRMKTPDLMFETLKIGRLSKTDVAVCYIRGIASEKIVTEVKKRLKKIKIDTVLESGYVQPFLEEKPLSLFSTVGIAERPDTVCGKIAEGRIAVIIDGTPFCLLMPFLFVENFQSLDDYTMSPYFITFIRLLKYLSFFLSVLLPGLYVAIGEFNPEIFPTSIFYKVVDAEVATPFSLLWEALIIHTIYEIMREAGLRLPKSVGHAVSIVGALVIGEAAVTAGLIGAPMIIIVAITALSSYVIPNLYYPTALLRFVFIIIGGFTGVFGVILGLWMIVTGICSQSFCGVPYSAPISPFDAKSMRDTFVRLDWRFLSKRNAKVQKMNGTQENDN